MDLHLYMKVVWRFRLLAACGFLIALILSFYAYVSVAVADGGVRLTYRETEKWASYTKLFVTQQGFPWGYSVTPNPDSADPAAPPSNTDLRFADQARFTNLAVLYSQLATSDPVRKIIREDGPVRGTVIAAPVLALNNPGNPLPIISLAGISDTPIRARDLAARATIAMQTYLRRQQESNRIPERDRVEVQVLESPGRPQLFQGRSKTLPVILFLTLMIATTGLAFFLENVRPASRPMIAAADPDQAAVRSRRTA